MRLIHLLLPVLSALTVAASAELPVFNAAAQAPGLQHIFSAYLTVAPAIGGVIVPEGTATVLEVTKGEVVGPDFIALIHGGALTVTALTSPREGLLDLSLWGVTADGVPLLAKESGVQNAAGRYTRLVMDIGGKYAYLASEFILTKVSAASTNTTIIAEGYLVQ